MSRFWLLLILLLAQWSTVRRRLHLNFGCARTQGSYVSERRCVIRAQIRGNSRSSKQTTSLHPPPPPLPEGSDRIGLLVDGDQISPASFKPLLEALGKFGSVPVRRIYLSDHAAGLWSAQLKQFNIRVVRVPRFLHGTKDPSDIAIALGAAELALKPADYSLSAIAIASKDVDFAFLHRQLRAWGVRTFAVVPDSFANYDVLRSSCNDLVKYSMDFRKPLLRVVLDTSNTDCKAEVTSINVNNDQFNTDDLKRVVDVLIRLGYIEALDGDDHLGELLVPAIVRFFHMNQLGALTVKPRCMAIQEAINAVVSYKETWIPDVGNFAYFEPRGSVGNPSAVNNKYGTTDMARFIRGGGPFLCHISPDLVEVVLGRMGYCENEHLHEAIDLFIELNSKALFSLGVYESDDQATKKRKLHDIFSSRLHVQCWKVPLLDDGLRNKFVALKLLPSNNVSESEVLKAIRIFLVQTVGMNTVPLTYAGSVARCLQYIGRDNPNRRK